MAIFKINKDKNYTTMSNYHLKDRNLSLKAKGMLSLMLSLPDNWDYSVRGLTEICKETKDTINNVLKELEENKYLVRKRIYCNGKISDWEYNIYEKNDLHPKNQDIENQDIENWDVNKYTNILNTKEYKKETINNKLFIEKKEKKFIKPTLEEVQEYCNERKNNIDAQNFIDYYDSVGWKVGKNPMKDWKASIRTWENKEKKKIQVKSSRDKMNEVFEKFLKEG